MGGKTYKTFDGAVKFIMKSQGLSKDRASAYVMSIDKDQHPKSKNRMANKKVRR
jgi:hypothetical protein